MTPHSPFLRRMRAGLTDRRGAAAVEFAFIATILLLMITGGFDLSRAMDAKRDTDRAAAEVSNAMAQCTTTNCVLANGQSILAAQTNVMPTMPGATFSWAMVSRVNSAIVVDFGNMTTLQSDVNAAALKVLANNNDNGVCVVMTYDSSVTGMMGDWAPGFGKFRSFTCNLQSRNQQIAGGGP